MRRLILVPFVAAAVFASSAAAATLERTLTIPGGAHRARTVAITTSAAGTVKVVFRFSDIVNPHAKFKIVIRRAGTSTSLPIMNAPNGNCEGAAGSIFCTGKRTGLAAGKYFVTVRRFTTKQSTVELRVTYP